VTIGSLLVFREVRFAFSGMQAPSRSGHFR
jgi:hypothetical protein